jgi:hypothetical protein
MAESNELRNYTRMSSEQRVEYEYRISELEAEKKNILAKSAVEKKYIEEKFAEEEKKIREKSAVKSRKVQDQMTAKIAEVDRQIDKAREDRDLVLVQSFHEIGSAMVVYAVSEEEKEPGRGIERLKFYSGVLRKQADILSKRAKDFPAAPRAARETSLEDLSPSGGPQNSNNNKQKRCELDTEEERTVVLDPNRRKSSKVD